MPKFIWKLITIGPKLIYRLGLGGIIGRRIVLLTTTGRKSGLARTTPLQYEFIEGKYIVGSARGLEADWVRNILANPIVTLQVGSRRFSAKGEVLTDRDAVARFLQQRFENHPIFIRLVLRAQGIRGELNNEVFLRYVEDRVMVMLEPTKIES